MILFSPIEALDHAVIWHPVIGETLALSGALISTMTSDEAASTTFSLPSATLDNDLFSVTSGNELRVGGGALSVGSYHISLHVSSGSGLKLYNATIEVVAGHSQPKIAGGALTSYAMAQDGSVYSWGYGFDGSLGQGDENNRTTPTLINASNFGGEEVVDIVACFYSTLSITRNGNVYAFGRNHAGQLGVGDRVDRLTPTLVQGALVGKRVVRVVPNEFAALFLVDDGSIYGTGVSSSSGLGTSVTVPTWISSTGPSATSGSLLGKLVISFGRTRQGIAMVTEDGELYCLGKSLGLGLLSNATTPTLVQGGVKQFFLCDFDTGFMLGSDDVLYITGEGAGGRLGWGSSQDIVDRFEPLDIASKTVYKLDAGYYSTLTTMTDGTLYGFGGNNNREAVRASGTALNPVQETSSFTGQFREVRVCLTHSIVLTSTGDLYTVGSNSHGQLGNGTTSSSTTYINLALNLGATAQINSVTHPSATTLSSAISSFSLRWQSYELGELLNEL